MQHAPLARPLAVALLSTCALAGGFSASGSGGPIPALGTGGPDGFPLNLPPDPALSTVSVPDAVASVSSVQITGLAHTWMNQIQCTLVDPVGVEHLIFVRPDSTGDFFAGDFEFVESGAPNDLPQDGGRTHAPPGQYNQSFVSHAGAWVSGDAGVLSTPLGSISGPAGTWSLKIYDWVGGVGGDVGSFTGWTLNGTVPSSWPAPVAAVLVGDAVPGVGTVTSVDDFAVDDSGSVHAVVDTDYFDPALDGVALQDGVPLEREGDALTAPAGATIAGFRSLDVSGSGTLARVLELSTSTLAVYHNDTLVAETGTAPMDTGSDWISPTYCDFYEVFVNDASQLLLGGLVFDSLSFLGLNEFLSLISVDGLGSPVSEYVRYRSEWVLPSFASGFVDSVPVRPESTSLGEQGHSLFFVREGGTPQEAILRDLTTGAGGPSASTMIVESFFNGPTGAWIDSTALAGADLNAADDWVSVLEAAPLAFGAPTERIFLSSGGVVSEYLAEGDSFAAIAPHSLVALGFGGPIHLTDAGEILWYGRWDDPDTSRDEGLFLDDQLVVQEGVTTIGGSLLTSIDPLTFAASAAGTHLLFEGTLADGSSGLFHQSFEPPVSAFCFGDGSGTACPCGNAGDAGKGCDNSFTTGGGVLASSGFPSVAADTLTLSVSGLPNTAPGLYFQGETQQNAGLGVAFGDGLRCAGGMVIRLGTKGSSGGMSSFGAGVGGDPLISVKGNVHAGGATRTYQVWYRNSAPFCTSGLFNLTNGLQVDWQP